MRLHVYSLVFFFLLFHYKLVYTRIQSRILYVCYYYHVYCYYDRAISKWIFVPICIYSIIKSDDWRRRNMIQAFLLNSIWVTLARETMYGTNWIEHTDYTYIYKENICVPHWHVRSVSCGVSMHRMRLSSSASQRSRNTFSPPLSGWTTDSLKWADHCAQLVDEHERVPAS